MILYKNEQAIGTQAFESTSQVIMGITMNISGHFSFASRARDFHQNKRISANFLTKQKDFCEFSDKTI